MSRSLALLAATMRRTALSTPAIHSPARATDVRVVVGYRTAIIIEKLLMPWLSLPSLRISRSFPLPLVRKERFNKRTSPTGEANWVSACSGVSVPTGSGWATVPRFLGRLAAESSGQSPTPLS